MKKKNQKELSFTKETIAVLSNIALRKVIGGNLITEDPGETSDFYSDGPPHTSKALSDGPPSTGISD